MDNEQETMNYRSSATQSITSSQSIQQKLSAHGAANDPRDHREDLITPCSHGTLETSTSLQELKSKVEDLAEVDGTAIVPRTEFNQYEKLEFVVNSSSVGEVGLDPDIQHVQEVIVEESPVACVGLRHFQFDMNDENKCAEVCQSDVKASQQTTELKSKDIPMKSSCRNIGLSGTDSKVDDDVDVVVSPCKAQTVVTHTKSGLTLQKVAMINPSISKTCPSNSDIITVVNPLTCLSTSPNTPRFMSMVSQTVTVVTPLSQTNNSDVDVNRVRTSTDQVTVSEHNALCLDAASILNKVETSILESSSTMPPSESAGAFENSFPGEDVKVGAEIVRLVMSGYPLDHVESKTKTEADLEEHREATISSEEFSFETTALSEDSVPDFVAAETVVTTTVPKKWKTSSFDQFNALNPSLTQFRTDIAGTHSSWNDWPQQLSGDTQLIQTGSSGINMLKPCMDSTLGQESFVALMPNEDLSSSHEASIREITKRERDRMKKRELRANPQFRERERQEAKLRMKVKRADPAYREYERQKDRLRRRQARQRNDQTRLHERERDKEYKRLQRNGISSVMTEVDMSNLTSSVMVHSEDDSNFPTHEKTYKLMIWD